MGPRIFLPEYWGIVKFSGVRCLLGGLHSPRWEARAGWVYLRSGACRLVVAVTWGHSILLAPGPHDSPDLCALQAGHLCPLGLLACKADGAEVLQRLCLGAWLWGHVWGAYRQLSRSGKKAGFMVDSPGDLDLVCWIWLS